MAFAQTWAALQTRLRPGTAIPNWTVHSGLVGEPFEVVEVAPDAIVVSAPGAATPQNVRRADFEAVYERWEDYIRRAVPRKTFTPLTWYSKYVISILHWFQEQSGGQLP